MKLLRHTPKNTEALEMQFTVEEEMSSPKVEVLKAKATDLCKHEKMGPAIWVSRHPVMGDEVIRPDIEWLAQLDNGTFFSIEK